MNHPAELQVFSYLQKAMKGEATMTEEVATQVASDVKAALDKHVFELSVLKLVTAQSALTNGPDQTRLDTSEKACQH